MDLRSLLPLHHLRHLCEEFTALTGAVTAVLDLEGTILVATGWQDLCTCFHRVNPDTAARCRKSDTILAAQLQNGQLYNIYQCENGLVDVAVPIVVMGQHVGNFFTGQFFLQRPDRACFEAQARQFSFPPDEYLAAVARVPIFTEANVRSIMGFFTHLTHLIAEISLARMQQENANLELQKKNEELKRSNEDLERFAYATSHDLQSPLRKTIQFSQLLKRRHAENLDQTGHEYLDFIIENGHQMSQLISDILEYSRVARQRPQLERTSSRIAIETAMQILAAEIAAAEAEIILGDLPEVIAESALLVSLFQNLISNAVKYRDPQRPLVVSVNSKPIGPGQIRFEISDNGIGIDPVDHERIFEIFQRLTPASAQSGTGIGLTLCRQIVQRLGGEMSLTSSLGAGTTFFFTLCSEPP